MEKTPIEKIGGASLSVLLATSLCVPSSALAVENQSPESELAAASTTATSWSTYGTCEWRIDDTGCLVIRPADDATEGSLPAIGSSGGAPWYNSRESITSARFDGTIHAKSLGYLFNGLTNLVSVDLKGLDSSSATSAAYMFNNCSSLTTVDLSLLDTSNATSMYCMFYGCSSLKSIDASSFNTSRVTTMQKMFMGCSAATSINVSSFDVSKVTDMQYMFSSCSSLASLDLSEMGPYMWSVTDISYMFQGCKSLRTLDLTKLDTSKVNNMSYLFAECSQLETINTTGFYTGAVTNMNYMFSKCSNLKILDLTSFATNKVEQMSYMFSGCISLKTLDISTFDTYQITQEKSPDESLFQNCSSLEIIKLGAGFCTNFNHKYDLYRVPFPYSSANNNNGQWVNSKGKVYSYDSIPSRTADTYYSQAKLNFNAITVDTSDATYTGSPITDRVTSKKYTEGEDYQVDYSHNTSAGEATITVTGLKAFGGQSQSYSFNIVKGASPYTNPGPLSATVGQTLGDLTLPQGFTWQDDAATSVGTVGEHTFLAAYTPEDTESFDAVTDIPVKVQVSDLINASMFTLDQASATYDGNTHEPTVTSTLSSNLYSVSYRDNINAGTGYAVITGQAPCTGTVEIPFTIAKATPSYQKPSEIAAEVGQTLADLKLPEGFSWQDADSTNVGDAGTHTFLATFTPADTANYNNVTNIPVTVQVKGAINASMFSITQSSLTYDGTAQTPAITSTSVPDNAYTVTYSNNVNAGLATATITGTAPYSGTCELTFRIAPAQVRLASNTRTFTYNGLAQSDATVVTSGASDLFKSQISNLRATGSITNVAEGKVSNTISYTWKDGCSPSNFQVTTAPGTLSVTAKSIDGGMGDVRVSSASNVTYDGSSHAWKPTVSFNGSELAEGLDYTVSASTSDFTNAGTISVTITGCGNFTGSASRTYSIAKRPVTLTTESHVFVYDGSPHSWDKWTCSDSLFESQIESMACTASVTDTGETKTNTATYAFKPGFRASNFNVTEAFGTLSVKDSTDQIIASVSNSTFTYDGKPHGTSVTVSGLPSGYTLERASSNATVTNVADGEVQATVDDLVIRNSVNEDVTAKLNIKKVAGTLKVTPATLAATTPSASKVYDGTPLIAQGALDGLADGETATLSTTGTLTNAGNATNTCEVIWDGTAQASNYQVIKSTGVLTVDRQSIVPADNGTYRGVTILDPSPVTYDGSKHEAVPELSTSNGVKLTQGSDFTVSYGTSDLVNAGRATLTVTGCGNYTGSYLCTFDIVKAKPTVPQASALAAAYGQTLADVALPDGFSWQDAAATSVGAAGEHTFLATYTPADTANYEIVRDVAVKVNVAAKAIDASMFSVDTAVAAYTGQAVDGRVSSKDLTEGIDYEIAYSDNVNAGTAKIVVTGKGNYAGTLEYSFKINKAVPSYTAPTGASATYGQTLADIDLPSGYTWQDESSTSVGSTGEHTFLATFTPTDTANYEIVRNVPVKVNVSAKAIEASMFSVDSTGLSYTGSALEPAVASGSVPAGSYSVSYRNNVNAGTGYAIVTGKGDYAGTVETPFAIAKAAISSTQIEPIADQTYEGSAVEPEVVATFAGKRLAKGVDYEVSYSNNGGPGAATATVSGIGNFAGTRDIAFNVVELAKPDPVSISERGGMSFAGSVVYMGVPATNPISVFCSGVELVEGIDYDVSYAGNDGFGKATLTVTGKGSYTGVLTATFDIVSAVVDVFDDASYGDWYVDSGALDYAWANGLISGYAGTRLVGAYDPIKRQDVAVILWRMAGEPEANGTDRFEDVDYSDYYGPAVAWARESGVINGYRDADGVYRTFRPGNLVSRQELAAMIANYARQVGGVDTSSGCAKLDALPDASSVADWARESMGWCMDAGIMNGMNVDGVAHARPDDTAWRASMASMATALHRDVLQG